MACLFLKATVQDLQKSYIAPGACAESKIHGCPCMSVDLFLSFSPTAFVTNTALRQVHPTASASISHSYGTNPS